MSVEHEYQQDVKLALLRILLDELQLVPVISADLIAGDAGLLLLTHDAPAHFCGELMAGFPLHGDVCLVVLIVVDLFIGGNSV